VASGREQYLQALASLSDLTRTQAERVAGLLAKQGEVQSAQVGRVAEDLMRRTHKNREIMTRLIQREVKRQLGVLGMATRDEVARLQQRVRALEQEVERASKSAAKPSAATGSTGSTTRSRSGSSGTAKPATRSRAASSGAAGSTTRTRAGSSGTTKRSTRSKSASSGTAKPSTRTRTAGASSRSSASSPRTRRTRESAPPETGTPPEPGTQT
jgi:polyhydroxyalkanoate synthesis regulator phasin